MTEEDVSELRTVESEKLEDNSTKILWVIILAFSVIAGAMGWFLGRYIVDNLYPGNVGLKHGQLLTQGDALAKEEISSSLVDFPPIFTNLKNTRQDAKTDDIWVRVQLALLLKKDRSLDKLMQNKIVDNFLSYFRGTTLEEMYGSMGLLHIKEDLLNRANILSKDAVKQIFIKTLLVQ